MEGGNGSTIPTGTETEEQPPSYFHDTENGNNNNSKYNTAGATVSCCGKQISKKKCVFISLCSLTLTILIGVGLGILIWWLVFYDDGLVKENKIKTEETEIMVVVSNQTYSNSTGSPTQLVEVIVEKVYSWYLDGGFVAEGHDVVEYFNLDSSDNAVKGDEDLYAYEWEGAKFAFVNAENMNLFIENPTDYAPRFGGYCAYAMASGYTASVDADAWTVYNGQLYLNFNKNVRNSWDNSLDSNINKGDNNWGGEDFDNDNWDADF